MVKSPGGRVNLPDPIASLTIVSTPVSGGPGPDPMDRMEQPNTASSVCTRANTCSEKSKGYLQSDRIPLWALAPGMNVLQGSTSASIGIKLSDFSALNLVNQAEGERQQTSVTKVASRSKAKGGVGFNKSTFRSQQSGEVWVDSSPLQAKHRILVPPVEPISRPSTPAAIDNISTSDSEAKSAFRQHLTPPEKFTPPELFKPSLSPGAATGKGSFPRLARIPHWRRGRKELAEDVLEELGKGLELDGVLEEMRNLGLWDMEQNLHVDRIRRASEHVDGSLLELMDPNGRREDGA